MRLTVDGVTIGESHGRAWAAQAPLLGITGHAAHERTLGSLAGTPYLVVQEGDDPHTATPAFADGEEAAEAIRAFARRCAEDAAGPPAPTVPREARLEAVLDDATDAHAERMAAGGWTRTGDATLAAELATWADAREPIAAAMAAALVPIVPTWSQLDPSSREMVDAADPAVRDELTRLFLEATARMAR